ncbi:MAG: porin PorA family protein [Candidatus Nomurabacteria bacterium]|nr:porin PorA family protein [Candidatus Nomurabacteria bacterium]
MEEHKIINKKILFLSKSNILIFSIILFSIIWIFFLAPQILKIPKDFSYKADVISVDNLYDKSSNEFSGESYSKTKFSYETISSSDNNLMIKNSFDVKTIDGKQIFKTDRLYGINSLTGEHVKGLGDKDREGYLFAPRGIKKGQSYTYWHVDVNTPATMNFVGEENLYGLNVYKYETNYGGAIDQTANFVFLPEVGKTLGVKLLSKNYLWIEPVSGYLVKQQDMSTDYYFYDLKTGEKLYPYNQFSNIFSEKSTEEHTLIAKKLKTEIIVANYLIPIILFILAIIMLALKLSYFDRILTFVKSNFILIFVTIVMFLGSFTGYYFLVNGFDKEKQVSLETQSIDITEKILNKTSNYLRLPLNGRALFNASVSVERNEWSAFVKSLDLLQNYPGVQGLGFLKIVLPNEKNLFVQSVKKEGFSDFNIIPVGDRNIYTPVIYLEPWTPRNIRDLGFDMFSNKITRNSIIKARDSGEISVSSKVALLQDNGTGSQFGFFAFSPVYKNNSKVGTVEERRKEIIGYTYYSSMIKDFLTSIFNNQKYDLDFKIYDGLKISNESLIYDSGNGSISNNVFFHKVETIYLKDHPWTIEYVNSSNYQKPLIDKVIQYSVLFGSLLVTFLVFSLILSISKSKESSVLYAASLTKDLEAKQDELKKNNQTLKEKLNEVDKMNKLMIGRELTMLDLKKEIDKLKRKI